MSIDEYYRHIFENTPGLPEKAREEGLSALEYMRHYGAFEVEKTSYLKHLAEVPSTDLEGAITDFETGVVTKGGSWRRSLHPNRWLRRSSNHPERRP